MVGEGRVLECAPDLTLGLLSRILGDPDTRLKGNTGPETAVICLLSDYFRTKYIYYH